MNIENFLAGIGMNNAKSPNRPYKSAQIITY